MALEMTWQRPFRRKSSPVGFRNLGNTCYLNSVLQCLTYTPPLANFCLRNQHSSVCEAWNGHCPLCLVEKRIVRSLNSDIPLDAPLKIQSSLELFAKHFRTGRQEDAHEFLRYLIEACNDVCVKLYKARNSQGGKASKREPDTIVKDIFGGVLQSQVKCLSCGAESNKMDEIMDISLDILHASSLKEAFCRYFQSELLDGNNKYRCEKCKKLSTARKQMSIFQAPNVLVIQLKRFEDIYGGKIDRNIIFEERLALSGHMCRDSQDVRSEYTLFGTIVHSGYSQDSGHYYAYVKDQYSQWYCCNDAHVSSATLQTVLSEKVYMLFFLRSNPRAKGGKDIPPSNGAIPAKENGNGMNVSSNERSSVSSNSSVGIASCGGVANSGLSKVHPKSQKCAGSQAGRGGIVANGNGISKPPVTMRQEKHESCGKRISERSNPDASYTCNSSNVKKAEILVQRQHSESICESDNGRLCSFPSKSSSFNSHPDCHAGKTDGESCVTGSKDGDLLAGDLPVVERKTGSNDSLATDRLVKTANGTSPYSQAESNGFNCNRNMVKDNRRSLSNGNENSSEEKLFSKRRREEYENAYTGISHIDQENGALEHNVQSRRNTEANEEDKLSELDKLRQMLCLEARQHLQSCGWCDDVRESMRKRKRIHVDHTSFSSNDIDSRKLLIHDVKDSFIRQVPESLKEQLISRLGSFFRGKQ